MAPENSNIVHVETGTKAKVAILGIWHLSKYSTTSLYGTVPSIYTGDYKRQTPKRKCLYLAYFYEYERESNGYIYRFLRLVFPTNST
jgi:hypothetical protein